MIDIIKKKRDGFELSKLEIQSVIDGIMNNQIPDYQISAFLMALYFKKMNEKVLIFEQDKDDSTLLDEKQLKE